MKRSRGRERGKVSEAVSRDREPFHHSLCCETVPLLGLSDANCWEESILPSAVFGCHSDRFKATLKRKFCISVTSFLLVKCSEHFLLIIEVKPSGENRH